MDPVKQRQGARATKLLSKYDQDLHEIKLQSEDKLAKRRELVGEFNRIDSELIGRIQAVYLDRIKKAVAQGSLLPAFVHALWFVC